MSEMIKGAVARTTRSNEVPPTSTPKNEDRPER